MKEIKITESEQLKLRKQGHFTVYKLNKKGISLYFIGENEELAIAVSKAIRGSRIAYPLKKCTIKKGDDRLAFPSAYFGGDDGLFQGL
jgi:hypothetical protein